MRTTDERLYAVEKRVRELEMQRRQRKLRYMGHLAVAACLIIIVGVGTAMPGIIAGISGKDYNNTGMMASIFYEGKIFGYVLIGLLSFALGVCLTILCFLLQPGRHKDKGEDQHDVRTH